MRRQMEEKGVKPQKRGKKCHGKGGDVKKEDVGVLKQRSSEHIMITEDAAQKLEAHEKVIKSQMKCKGKKEGEEKAEGKKVKPPQAQRQRRF